ncbi:MAG: leucine-rich repeat domain-containing protein [Saprospiraceae bacterium]|nr:leucine-rich repeat domain-containing protein [Candidatus Brachybacter algidus]
MLTGSIPDYSHLKNLETLKLSDNQLTGNLPDFILPNLKHLTLRNNLISGTIPFYYWPFQ